MEERRTPDSLHGSTLTADAPTWKTCWLLVSVSGSLNIFIVSLSCFLVFLLLLLSVDCRL